MKAFLQAQDESIVINGDITVTVLKIDGDEVLLGIDAPDWMAIDEGLQQSSATGRHIESLPAR